jgi:hypothetical protein
MVVRPYQRAKPGGLCFRGHLKSEPDGLGLGCLRELDTLCRVPTLYKVITYLETDLA